MNNIQIEYFIELCKTLNFTRTAQNMYVSQPAVSKQISSLEKEIGFKLFERTNKDICLTPSGKLFYEFFLKAASEYKRTVKDAHNLVEKKTIVVGFLEAWDMSKCLPYITKSLLSVYPNIIAYFVSYDYKDLNSKIENGEIDIAVSISHNFENLSNINTKEIIKIPSLLFYSVAHHLANKPNLTFEDFKNETFYVFSDQSKISSRERVIDICSDYGFVPNIVIVPNIESMVLNVENGLGVAVFDEWIQYKNNPMLKSLETGYKHRIAAAWNDSHLNDFVNLFTDELILSLK